MKLLPCDRPRLRAELLARVRRGDVVSFDVFDTLVERSVEPPDLGKRALCTHLARMLDYRVPVSEILASRLQAESGLRERGRRTGADPEFRLDELVRHWAPQWLGRAPAPEEVEQLLAAQIDFESTLCRAVDGMPALIGELAGRGVRLYFLSDMYLPQAAIERLLSEAGYAGRFAGGLVSGERGRNKRSGRLYDLALQQWGVDAERLTHVGDDLHADVNVPRRRGIRAFWFRDRARDRAYLLDLWRVRTARRHPAMAGAGWAARVIAHASGRTARRRDTYYRIGLELVGPLLMNFVHRLQRRARAADNDLLVFAAREGFVLGELYDRLAQALPASERVPWVYAYVSRKSTYAAAVRGADAWARFLGTFTTEPTIGKLLQRLSLTDCIDAAMLAAAGFAGRDDATDAGDPRLATLFALPAFSTAVDAWRGAQADLLARYLDQLGVRAARRPALVDLGWYGSIQGAINRALRDRPDWPHLCGYYLLLWQHEVLCPADRSDAEGLLVDGRQARPTVPIGRFAELFETATRAPHGTTEGYLETQDGSVRPRLREARHAARRAELQDAAYVSGLQAGILDYADAYVALLPAHSGHPETESAALLLALDRLVRYPTAEEARCLLDFSHSEDVGQGLVHKGRGRQRASGERRRVLWPEGFWRSVGGLPLGLAYNVYRLLVRRSF